MVMSAAGRVRDLEVLRLSGATPRQVRGTVAAESVLVVLLGAGLGAVVALPALVGIRGAFAEAMRADVPLVIPWPLIRGADRRVPGAGRRGLRARGEDRSGHLSDIRRVPHGSPRRPPGPETGAPAPGTAGGKASAHRAYSRSCSHGSPSSIIPGLSRSPIGAAPPKAGRTRWPPSRRPSRWGTPTWRPTSTPPPTGSSSPSTTTPSTGSPTGAGGSPSCPGARWPRPASAGSTRSRCWRTCSAPGPR